MGIKDFILTTNVFSKEICQEILDSVVEWQQGTWYNANTDLYKNNTQKSASLSENIRSKYSDLIYEGFREYGEKYTCDHNLGYKFTSKVNRYDVGDYMEKHVDHIHSIFDGKRKGIPVLSMIGLLNDDFEGGDLVLFDDYKIELKTGDAVIFPSNFMYPHEVKKITKGVRYSWISWMI